MFAGNWQKTILVPHLQMWKRKVKRLAVKSIDPVNHRMWLQYRGELDRKS